MSKRDVVLFSTADWDNPFWTNKQHVATELARVGHKVLYIDSVGLRQPSVNGADLQRIFRRVGKAISSPKKVGENIWVWSPFVIPFQKYSVIRSINRRLFSLGLWWSLRKTKMRREIFWTYNPLTLKITSLAGYEAIVYHCVDEIKAQPGMPVDEIERAEKQLTSESDVCFVTALNLLDTRKIWNPNTFYFSNVADYKHFSSALNAELPVPDDLLSIPHPRIGFIGAISSYKLDLKLLLEMARARPSWNIVLLGKIGEGDPDTNVDELLRQRNIHLLGPKSYGSLPGYLKGMDVAILPSALNSYTRNMFPMKFFEYLAAGRPVVSTNLHALQEYRSVAYLASNSVDFISGVESALSGDAAPLTLRQEAAKEQTYEVRTNKMLAIVDALPVRSSKLAA